MGRLILERNFLYVLRYVTAIDRMCYRFKNLPQMHSL